MHCNCKKENELDNKNNCLFGVPLVPYSSLVIAELVILPKP
jgi:hypothetical protein